MKRRDFLQLTGLSTASALLAGCRQSNEKLIPFLVAPDDGIVPGRADYYASVCRQCPSGCGILVRVSEGRAKKVEGNPRHPVNHGRLCARGQAALQELYHPDRIRQPLKRSGPRGSGKFKPISWEEALRALTLVLDQIEKQRDGLVLMTPPLTGALAGLVGRFLEARNLPPESHLPWELLHPEWQVEAMLDSYGVATLPEYDVEKTQYLISFGADFAETFLSPVHYGDAFGKMRQARPTVRGRFAYVGGRLSQTAGSADRWLPVRPGTEGDMALCIAREVLVRGLHDEGALRAAGLDVGQLGKVLAPYTPEAVARSCDVPLEDVRATAHDFTTIRPAVAMAGDMSAWQSNGQETVKAVQLLNLLIGNLRREGGVAPVPAEAVGRSSYQGLQRQIERMQAGEVAAALVYGVNPVYSVPEALGMREALEKVPFVASFATILDDTARQADLILPDHAALESWGEVLAARVRQPVVGLMQPVVKPLYDTRAFADVLLALGRSAGAEGEKLLPWSDAAQMLRQSMRQRLGMDEGVPFDKKWIALLQTGGILDLPPSDAADNRFGQGGGVLPQGGEARFVGEEKVFPLHLQVYPSPAFADGRSAALPWLQQMPDPMSTVVWGSWVEINPQTAKERGIRHGDLVELRSPQGRLRLPAVVYPGIRPDVVAVPMGQGHEGMGRYAEGRGVNPLHLLAAAESVDGCLPAWGATRVAVRRVEGAGDLVTSGHPEGSYRRELLGF